VIVKAGSHDYRGLIPEMVNVSPTTPAKSGTHSRSSKPLIFWYVPPAVPLAKIRNGNQCCHQDVGLTPVESVKYPFLQLGSSIGVLTFKVPMPEM